MSKVARTPSAPRASPASSRSRFATAGSAAIPSSAPERCAQRMPLAIGAEAVLWGEGLPVDEIAAAAGTISYELLCGVSRRVAFDYV
ncbi:MAG: hypothetical protein EBT64_07550 [Gammaproteobacteria bacterium]|nr:hypothetical protein [Gammaproteobacteria bacterium]